MINTNELNACLARKGFSKVDGAKLVQVSPKTFYDWMNKGIMPTDKAEMLISALEIKNPQEIFLTACYLRRNFAPPTRTRVNDNYTI